jgi:hypothetical protein
MLQTIDFGRLTRFALNGAADAACSFVLGGESRPCAACLKRDNPAAGWRNRRCRRVFRRGMPRTRVFKV